MTQTKKLALEMYDPVTDGDEPFNIKKALNDNFNKLDDFADDMDSSKVDKVTGKVLSSNDYTTSEKTKLAGLNNYNDTEIKQSIATKVDKVAGMGLSSNDYTAAEKAKLGGIAAAAQVNVIEKVKINGVLASIDTVKTANITLTPQNIAALPASSIGNGTCTTASTTNAKVGVLSGFALALGAIVGIRFSNSNTASAATLNVNGTGAKPIYYNDIYVSSGMITAGMTALLQYNGSQWVLLNPAVNASSLFIIDITFDTSFGGKVFTVSASGFSCSGTVPSGLNISVVAPTPNALYTIICNGYTRTIRTASYFGVYPITITSNPPVLENATWSQIASAVADGNAPDTWAVGSEKNITLNTGETLTLQVYGKNHDDLSGGGKAAFTFGLKHLMKDGKMMNSVATNAGGFVTTGLYDWLQSSLYNSLPTDLRTAIKSVNKKTYVRVPSETVVAASMKVFLFGEVECFGTTTYSAAGEGTQYPIFTDNASRTKVFHGTEIERLWWLRSPRRGTTAHFCCIEADGLIDTRNSDDGGAVCFGFCI